MDPIKHGNEVEFANGSGAVYSTKAVDGWDIFLGQNCAIQRVQIKDSPTLPWVKRWMHYKSNAQLGSIISISQRKPGPQKRNPTKHS